MLRDSGKEISITKVDIQLYFFLQSSVRNICNNMHRIIHKMNQQIYLSTVQTSSISFCFSFIALIFFKLSIPVLKQSISLIQIAEPNQVPCLLCPSKPQSFQVLLQRHNYGSSTIFWPCKKLSTILHLADQHSLWFLLTDQTFLSYHSKSCGISKQIISYLQVFFCFTVACCTMNSKSLVFMRIGKHNHSQSYH